MMITEQDFVLCEERNLPTEYPFVVSIILLFPSSRFTVNREQFLSENQQIRYYFRSCYILESMLELEIGKPGVHPSTCLQGVHGQTRAKKNRTNRKIARDHQTLGTKNNCLTMDKAPQLELMQTTCHVRREGQTNEPEASYCWAWARCQYPTMTWGPGRVRGSSKHNNIAPTVDLWCTGGPVCYRLFGTAVWFLNFVLSSM